MLNTKVYLIEPLLEELSIIFKNIEKYDGDYYANTKNDYINQIKIIIEKLKELVEYTNHYHRSGYYDKMRIIEFLFDNFVKTTTFTQEYSYVKCLLSTINITLKEYRTDYIERHSQF